MQTTRTEKSERRLQKTAILPGNTIIILDCTDSLFGQPNFYSSNDRLPLPDVKTTCKIFCCSPEIREHKQLPDPD